jgi:hypothetical protein
VRRAPCQKPCQEPCQPKIFLSASPRSDGGTPPAHSVVEVTGKVFGKVCGKVVRPASCLAKGVRGVTVGRSAGEAPEIFAAVVGFAHQPGVRTEQPPNGSPSACSYVTAQALCEGRVSGMTAGELHNHGAELVTSPRLGSIRARFCRRRGGVKGGPKGRPVGTGAQRRPFTPPRRWHILKARGTEPASCGALPVWNHRAPFPHPKGCICVIPGWRSRQRRVRDRQGWWAGAGNSRRRTTTGWVVPNSFMVLNGGRRALWAVVTGSTWDLVGPAARGPRNTGPEALPRRRVWLELCEVPANLGLLMAASVGRPRWWDRREGRRRVGGLASRLR